MKILKKLLIAIIALILLALIAAFFVKKEYTVVRETTINKPKQEVFNYVKYLKNQDNYSTWASMDPSMKKTHEGIDGTVGFVAGWDSENENVGKGEQEIIKIVDGERIDYELRFYKPFESTCPSYMTTTSQSDNQTKVAWAFNGKMDYPMNLMLLFMDFEKEIGKSFDDGLSNLKEILEK